MCMLCIAIIVDDSSPQNLYTMTLMVTFNAFGFVDTRFKKQYAQRGQHFEILSAFFFPHVLSFMHEVSEMMC